MQYNQNKQILNFKLKYALDCIKKSKEIAKNSDCLQFLKPLKDIEKSIINIINQKGV